MKMPSKFVRNALLPSLALTALAGAVQANTVTYVLYETIDVFGDPVMNVNFSEQKVSKALFEPLIWDFDARAPEGEKSGLRPALATEWENIDDLSWRFKLREGVTFHNGVPFTADAVKWSIERPFQDGFPSGDKFLDVPIDHVEIVNDYEVIIHTTEPVPILPERLSRNGAFILEPGHYQAIEDIDDYRLNPMGTGPFKLNEYRADDRIILDRHDDYWGWHDNSNVERLVFRNIPEQSTALSELIDGNVDIIGLQPDLVDAAERVNGVTTIVAPSLVRGMLGFNMDMYEELRDPRVRQALNYAINREELVNAVAFGNQALQMVNVVNPPHDNPNLAPYPYDPDRARALLAEAGYPDGFTIDTIDVMTPESFDYAEIVAAYWRAIGMDIGQVRQLDWSVVRERWGARTLSVHAFNWSAGENLPETDMWAVHDGRQTNSTHWATYSENYPEWEAMYSELTTLLDQDRRQELSYAMQEILHEDPPWAYTYLLPLPVGVSERIGGYYPHPSMLVEDWASIYVKE